ncbi:flap endonuclease GEN [Bacillus rossius redtenbacheri]|uniref:flap endonuclease GEN n=1 Tax=Bacillus rossius redtenbacheri TaxID=93214 RepID=UPI002FDED526
MGVKDLWSILSPVCERKPLWELQDKSVAIDLSGWVCDSQNLTQSNVQPRMYLRNLFFRTSCLLLMDVMPVFVLEGDAPALKHDTISQRNQKQYGRSLSQRSQGQSVGKKGSRKRLTSILKQCKEILEAMGVPCVQSRGEAEALCARLNMAGAVDGCISQDGDCFLYGARTVYRNFTVSHSGTGGSSSHSVDLYDMGAVEDRLSLDRRKLVALSVLCGCDYNGRGVAGVGKETALKFLGSVRDEDVLDRLRRWRSDPRYDELEAQREQMCRKDACERCGHPGRRAAHDKSGCRGCSLPRGCVQDSEGLRGMDPESCKLTLEELKLRRKALQDPLFPYQQLIDEFLASDEELPRLDWVWGKPNIEKFIGFAGRMLAWAEDYAAGKILPLAARWHLRHGAAGELRPLAVRRACVRRGVPCLEVEWHAPGSWPGPPPATVEPAGLVEAACPHLVRAFLRDKEAKRRKPKRATKKTAAIASVPHECTAGGKGECRGHLCTFLQRQDRGAGVESLGRHLAALAIDDEKENAVPGHGANKPRAQPAKRGEPKVKLKDLLMKIGQGSGKDGTEKSCFVAEKELQLPDKKSHGGYSPDLSSGMMSDSLNISGCSKCEDDCSMDLSSIIHGIVGRGNTLSPLGDGQSFPRTPAFGSSASDPSLHGSECTHSTPKCFVDVNFSLGTSRFLAAADESHLSL